MTTTRMPRLILSCWCGLVAALATPLGSAQNVNAPNTPLAVFCDVTYAGHTQRVPITVTDQPYAVPSQSIGGRFRFKAMHVRGTGLIERISLYVYLEDTHRTRLIQHVQLPLPQAESVANGPIDLLGEQHLYSGPLERELIYTCTAQRGQP